MAKKLLLLHADVRDESGIFHMLAGKCLYLEVALSSLYFRSQW